MKLDIEGGEFVVLPHRAVARSCPILKYGASEPPPSERGEVKKLLLEFNLPHLSDAAIETLIDFADFDGDGEIDYAEFARVLTADDILNMKATKTAVQHDPSIKVGLVRKAVAGARK